MMDRGLVKLFYHTGKVLGLFHISRRVTRRCLRILCYHGFAQGDELAWRPGLYTTMQAFEERLRYMTRRGYPVLPLDDAVARLAEGTLPPAATVITIDDGFSSCRSIAYPLLRKYDMPATIYLTSYYFEKKTPVFRLVVDYMIWKAAKKTVDLSDIGVPALEKRNNVGLDEGTRGEIAKAVIAHGEQSLDEPGRVDMARRLGENLGIDYDDLACDGRFSMIKAEDIHEMTANGIAIELHTHRHRFPPVPVLAAKEIHDNRAAVEPLLNAPMRHFCYPSGEWTQAHWPVLESAGVRSATTCDSGLNDSRTPKYALRRILDDSRVSLIEIEAELSGFSEVVRRARSLPRRLRSAFAGPRPRAAA